MAIEIQPESAQHPGGREPGAAPKARPWWMRPAFHTAIVGAVIGYVFGHWLGSFLAGGYQAVSLNDNDDFSIVLGYAFGVLGWLIGLGVFNDLYRQMIGKPVRVAEEDLTAGGLSKYFRYSLDHKVVGIQYLFAMVAYFLTGGLFAMAIRTELLSPSYHVLSANAYLEVVGEHGTMMMMMMSSVVIGPFGNYLVPLMIGSKRVAFPRIEALSFWLTPCAYIILLSSILFGGFPTGWTGYAPLSIQAGEGMDGYAVAFGLMGISMILAAFNIVVTIICYRAPGMRWSRLPMFVWAMLTTGFLHGAGRAGARRRHVHDPHRPDGADRVLRQPARRQQLPVRGPVLVLRPSRGVHPGAARLRHRERDHPGVLPQAAVRLQDRRGGHVRRGDPVLLRLAAPPVRLRHRPGHAAAVHADHRTHLDPHRVHLPGRDGHVLEGQDQADACRCCSPWACT